MGLLRFSYRHVGDGFDPSLGFVPRRGINSYQAGCTYAPRPKGTFIRQMFHELFPSLTTDLDGRWESYRVFIAPVNWRLESGDRFELNVAPAGEQLPEPFEIADGVVIPPGAYHWMRYRVEVGTAAKRKLSGQASWWFGGFYTGTLDQIELEAVLDALAARHLPGRGRARHRAPGRGRLRPDRWSGPGCA